MGGSGYDLEHANTVLPFQDTHTQGPGLLHLSSFKSCEFVESVSAPIPPNVRVFLFMCILFCRCHCCSLLLLWIQYDGIVFYSCLACGHFPKSIVGTFINIINIITEWRNSDELYELDIGIYERNSKISKIPRIEFRTKNF